MNKRLSWIEVRTLILSSLGSALEYYDFTVFVFLAPIISVVFFPPGTPEWIRLLQTFAIFALGYFVRPIGGIVIAHFGDRVGRKKMFMFSLMLMAVPTLLIGFLPTYSQVGWLAPGLLLLMRLLQGFAVAGELPGAIIFVSEHSAARRVSFSCAALSGFLYLGLALGSGMSGLLVELFPDQANLYAYGWRIPFVLGGLFGLTSAYLRRFLQETPLFSKLKAMKQTSQRLPIVIALQNHFPACLFVCGLAFFLNQLNTTLFQYMPTLLLGNYGMASKTVFWANTAGILTYAVLNPLWGLLGDGLGRGRAMSLGAIATGTGVAWFFYRISAGTGAGTGLMVSWCGLALGAGFVGLMGSMAASIFPTPVRLTGFAFSYNVATAISAGITPLALTWLTHILGRTAPAYVALVACFGFFILGLIYPKLRVYIRQSTPVIMSTLQQETQKIV
jgi:MFS family permease